MIVNVYSLLRNTLFLLLAIYFAQGPLYSSGSIIGKVSLLGILIISSYFLCKAVLLKVSKPLLFYAIASLLMVNFLGYFAGGVYGGIYLSQIRSILVVLLTFFSFYYLAQKGYLQKKHLLHFFVLMLPIVIASFYYSKNTIISELTTSSENFVTNTAYLFVALIPFVFFFDKKKILSLLSLLVLIFFIIQSGKRGALITAVLGAVVFVYYQFVTVSPSKKLRGYAIALVGVFVIITFSINFFESNEYLIQRMQRITEGGSGRDKIYTNLLSAWYNSNSILNYFLGFGFSATLDKSGSGHLAHNDWLELLTNFGLLGVIIYLFIFFSIACYVLNPVIPRTYRLIMLALSSMWFLQTLFSMYYNTYESAISMVVLGYLVGVVRATRNKTFSRDLDVDS